MQVSAVNCPLHCRVADIGDLLFLQLSHHHSTRAAFSSPQSAPHSSKVSFSALHPPHHRVSQTSLYLDIQRVTKRGSNPVLRQISAVVKPSLSKKTTAPRSSGGLRDMRFCRKKSKKSQYLQSQYLQRHRSCVVYIFLVCQELGRTREALPKQ